MARYAAFISSSHAADGRLAPAMQTGLRQFARPWYRMRSLRVFRDQTNLSATPQLWSSIVEALGDSEYFVLFASPDAAASPWVYREVEYWLAHKAASRLMLVLTSGNLAWSEAHGDFDWERSDALPRTLAGRFQQEPLYIDLRWARDERSFSTPPAIPRPVSAAVPATTMSSAAADLFLMRGIAARLFWPAGAGHRPRAE